MVIRGVKIKSTDYQTTSDGIFISTTKRPRLGYLITEYGKEAMKLVEEMEEHLRKLKEKHA